MAEESIKNEVDYSKHINVSSPKQEIPTSDQITLLQRIIVELQKRNNNSLTTYHIIYSIDTSIITKQKIDISSDTGSYATEMVILDKGGGVDIFLNDENTAITIHNGMQVVNEKIEHIYWLGTGTTGTAKIRFGLIK